MSSLRLIKNGLVILSLETSTIQLTHEHLSNHSVKLPALLSEDQFLAILRSAPHYTPIVLLLKIPLIRQQTRKFNVDTEIPDLSGKVILKTAAIP